MRQWHSEEHRKILDLAISTGVDPHNFVASWYFDVAPADVTPEQRQIAKQANYVYLYSANGVGIK